MALTEPVELSDRERACLISYAWPARSHARLDEVAVQGLVRRGLATGRTIFGRTEWRLTESGRQLRARMLDLCTMCDQPLTGDCLHWCPRRRHFLTGQALE